MTRRQSWSSWRWPLGVCGRLVAAPTAERLRWGTPPLYIGASVPGSTIRPYPVSASCSFSQPPRFLCSPCSLFTLTPPLPLLDRAASHLLATMAGVHCSLAVKVAVASVTVVLAVISPVSAARIGSCEEFSGHQVLSAPGGVLKLRDGREVRARIIDVGGCTTRPDWVTGKAHPDAFSNYTTMSRGTTKTSDAASQCVTGVPTKAGAAHYTSFQAIVIDTNGFKFTPSFVLEDIDAQDNAADPSEGWRETMSSLGAADGQLVYPRLSAADRALVGLRQFGMPAESLKAVGLPVVSGLTIEGAAFLAETPKSKDPWAVHVRREGLMTNGCCCSQRRGN